MVQMTKRERVMRTIRFEETDRTPVYDIIQNDALIEHLTGQKLTAKNGTRLTRKAIAACLDMTRMANGPWGTDRHTDERGIIIQNERWTSWIVARPWEDWAGMVEWIKGEIARVNAITYDSAYAAAYHDYIDTCQADFGDDTVLIMESGTGLEGLYHVVGLEQFSYLLADLPGLVEEWFEAVSAKEIERVHAVADPERLPVVLTYTDIAYKTGTLFSPAWLREHYFHRLKRLNDAWHDHGSICLFHSDGNLWGVMDDLIATGIDGLNPLEVLADMTVRGVREAYPDLFLTGGVDVSQLLPLGTPDEIRAACRENIDAANGRGYFLGSSTELHWEIPVENIMAMFETAWHYEVNQR